MPFLNPCLSSGFLCSHLKLSLDLLHLLGRTQGLSQPQPQEISVSCVLHLLGHSLSHCVQLMLVFLVDTESRQYGHGGIWVYCPSCVALLLSRTGNYGSLSTLGKRSVGWPGALRRPAVLNLLVGTAACLSSHASDC